MTTLRPFTCDDMYKFNNVNLDPLTETYGLSFYMQYLAHWPEYFQVAESPSGEIMGYRLAASLTEKHLKQYLAVFVVQRRFTHTVGGRWTNGEMYLSHSIPSTFYAIIYKNGIDITDSLFMGKAEGHGENWHGHVTALTVSPDFRRLGLAAALMNFLEDVSEKKRAYFVDLFVRVSNKVAINMYTNLGYIVYRTVLEYYSGDPDEDAYDMRKACSRDVKLKSVIPLPHPVRPEDVE